MTLLHGFELIKEQDIPEINTLVRLYRHARTGAEMMSLINDDENKSFGVTFKTPPEDSTGLPHIMEHCVLSGSRKYPLKEPFVEILKSSLTTFVNAFTSSDFTAYPVASQNVQDFYNLVDVYLDAVFYPNISENALAQEGWHYELENKEDALAFRGIVFNEMKGAYSSPDSLLGRYTEQAILPDTPYQFDSGGDPAVIPDLTYAQFKAFHETFYHPANARIFFYGDDDPTERLRLIDTFIAEFGPLDIDLQVPLQPRFDEPRQAIIRYDAGEEDEGDSKRGMMTVSWLLPEVVNSDLSMAFAMLGHILQGTPASPLKKALIDSGLGENVTGGGLSPYQREMTFGTGMKGIAVEDAGKIETLIMETLTDLAENGIDPEMIAASMNTVEFSLRENNTGSFPRGIAMMMAAVPVWLHGGDPVAELEFETALSELKAKVAAGGYFEGLIRDYFLNNNHRSTVILKPDNALREEIETAELDRLEKAQSSMDDAALEAIIKETEALRLMQETPDTPEALATIPVLKLDDLDKENKYIPKDVQQVADTTVLFHDIFTNGIVYLELGFDMHTLPQNYLPYMNLFGRSLKEMGTASEDYVRLAQRIGQKTGGIGSTTLISSAHDGTHGVAWFMLRGKSMVSQVPDLLAILNDMLLTVDFDNPDRFRQIVLQEKIGAESSLAPGGHIVAGTRLGAHITEAHWVREQTGGVSYLFFLRDLVERIDSDWDSILADLQAMRDLLVNRSTMIANVTLDAANWATCQPQLASFLNGIPAKAADLQSWTPDALPENEGLTMPAQVNYVAKGANLYAHGYKLHGSHVAIVNTLSMTYLWDRIRAQGGAYGGFASFDQASGLFAYVSYRDPNLLVSLDNYDGAADYLRNLEISDDDLVKSIIAAIGKMDDHMLPDAKGYSSLRHHLVGYTPEMRQKIREDVLGLTAEDFRTFGEALAAINDYGQVVVLGSPDAINDANVERGGFMQVSKVL